MSRDNGIAVIGAGGHAKVVIATLQETGEEIGGVFDDDATTHGLEILGIPVVGPVKQATDKGFERAVLAIGDNRSRQRLVRELAFEWVTAIHPQASVHPSVRLGPGTVVFARAVIQPETVIGDHVIVNTGATIDHDCRIGNFAHVAPGAHLAGNVTVGEGALLGIGSSGIPGVSVGPWAVVGAGAAVVNDVPAGATVRGVPAH